jgi:hypothetical protein
VAASSGTHKGTIGSTGGALAAFRASSRAAGLSKAPSRHSALSAAASTQPTVTLSAPPNPLRGDPVTFTATATATQGLTITEVDFQYRPAGTGDNAWVTFCSSINPGCSRTFGNSYTADFNTTTPATPNGIYDVRAVATDSAGNSGQSVVSDLVISNGPTYVGLADPGSPLNGKVTLTATPEPGSVPDHVTFLYCPTSEDCPANPGSWRTIAIVGPQLDENGIPTGTYVTTLDTAAKNADGTPIYPDGSYDLGVSAEDRTSNPPNGDAFQGGAVSSLIIDNTSPRVSLADPGGSLSNTATLTASASGSVSGVGGLKFEVAPAGTGNWTTVAEVDNQAHTASFDATASFDTRQFSDGSYDLRAEADSGSGVTGDSNTIGGVQISNPGAQRFGGFTLTDYAAPAFGIKLLGELSGPQHETWAIGQTNAPPPAPLTNDYTAQGHGQIVLLKYTDATGWQIVDVLRCRGGTGPCATRPDGSPFPLAGGSELFAGAMTGSGDAWVTLTDGGRPAVFHRDPGGQFEFDQDATSNLSPLFAPGTAPTMVLHESSSGTYGMLMSPSPPPNAGQVHLEYGLLSPDGTWTVPPQSNLLPSTYAAPAPGTTTLTLPAGGADLTAPGTGWAVLEQVVNNVPSLILARFAPSSQPNQSVWTFLPGTGLDVIDQTGSFAAGSQQSAKAGDIVSVLPTSLRVDGGGVWLSATVGTTVGTHVGTVVAHYDASSGRVVHAWCGSSLPRDSFECDTSPLDLDHPAAVPSAVFDTSQGQVELAPQRTSDFISVYSDGTWTSISTPGVEGGQPGRSVFADATDGWLVGTNTLVQLSGSAPTSPLAEWPEANRNPFLSAALPPGQSTTDTAGALAVGLLGTAMHYDPSAGWLVDPTPPRVHHIELTGVAFASPSLAFAVGQAGAILRWNGASWSEDPQSVRVTTSTLNAVAFGSDGQGWAVGGFGTILHYDGSSWSREQLDSQDAGSDVTSVAVAGQDVYAIASGKLVMRPPDGTWQQVSLPVAAPAGSLKLVSGLPDGGLAVAGKSLLLIKQSASATFTNSAETFNGIPVALAAFRDPSGELRAFVSVAPPIETPSGLSSDDGGFPAGDGDLLLETTGGWQDLSRDLPASSSPTAPGDGVVQPDPVLAIAASPDGNHAWAVGGYAGTQTADGIGTDQILAARSTDWFTSAIWRYDAGGSVGSSATTEGNIGVQANPGTVSFAFFSSPLCKLECAAVQNAQPDVNLTNAAAEISAFAQQPGGPAFALLGGNARGPIDDSTFATGGGQLDIGRLPRLLAGLSGVPTYAAYGPRDAVPNNSEPALPWAQAFANAPAPFGSGDLPPGFADQGSGDPTGRVHKYYAFDVSQNGGRIRAIVLDNSAGSLEASAPGQTSWLSGELSAAQAAGLPVVVFAAEPLDSTAVGGAGDADSVAAMLANAGVLGVFTTSGGGTNVWQNQQDQVVPVPADAPFGTPQVPDYEGATLTYQQSKNSGVLWYDVSVDTVADKLTVNAVPVVSSLALEPLDGLNVARSSTLRFQAIARRPAATIATTPIDPSFPGFDQYVGIPASTCSTTCIGPTYSFTSSDPVVGNFVKPTAPGSPFPALDANGKTIPSSKSGLFCAFNGGTTTVSITTGLLTTSLPVTVRSGGYGPPCGTVPGGVSTNVIVVPGRVIRKPASNPNQGPPPPPAQGPVHTVFPKVIPPPPPAPVVGPAPVPASKPVKPIVQTPVVPVGSPPVPVQPQPLAGVPPVVPPLIPTALPTVPPGGATVSAQATARREEKARKHASQSAYVTRPAGTSGAEWFYPAVGVITVLALLLAAGGLRPGPRPKPAFVELWEPADPPRPGRR